MKRIVLSLAALAVSALSFADEGMWMVNAISEALETKMQERGLELSAGEIYNADADGAALCDAIVSLDFGCTGSFISNEGLVITNHHCAYSDVFALSTEEHNYLEDGFWAMLRSEEVRIPGKHIQLLKKVIDVTDEANAIIEAEGLEGRPMGSRRLSHLIEQKYQQAYPDLVPSLASMWAGSKYYLALYKEYDDVRLVAAPPVSIAAFGGDIDNWEWPQHKGDFAMYRVYENGQPLNPGRKLDICTSGLEKGDYTMVIGYPGRTDRYISAPKLSCRLYAQLAVRTVIDGHFMDIMKRWMDEDESIRLKYSNRFFSLSNTQELYLGEIECCERYFVQDGKFGELEDLQEWIDADQARAARWGTLSDDLNATYDAVIQPEAIFTIYRQTLVNSSPLSLLALRIKSHPEQAEELAATVYPTIDMSVEEDIFRTAVTYYYSIPEEMMGPYQKEMYQIYMDDSEAFFEQVWGDGKVEYGNPLYKFYTDVTAKSFHDAISEAEGDKTMQGLNREYTRALYQMRLEQGGEQYPDANSTMRLTYGTVCNLYPRDGIFNSWKSSVTGIFEKFVPGDIDYDLKPEWKDIVASYSGAVNFLTDNDITGGNSGSPVLNSKGQLVGLAFDGNKESLASNDMYFQRFNKCVCVDINYVLFILKEYMHMDSIIEEIGK